MKPIVAARPGALRCLLLALLPFVFTAAPLPAEAAQGFSPCEGRKTALVIRSDEHRLWLCRAGTAEGSFKVALGRNGTGKQQEGDQRTPLGTYPLGQPRVSTEYHVFIPVGYPTPAQRRQGYTGSAIGIHGPKRSFAWAGWLITLFDWTLGCIALASDEEIEHVAAWVERERVAVVHIE